MADCFNDDLKKGKREKQFVSFPSPMRLPPRPLTSSEKLPRGRIGFQLRILIYIAYLHSPTGEAIFRGMSVHLPVNTNGIYFLTFTCYRWLSLIELAAAYDEVYRFFGLLNNSGHQVLGYVIMPNHVHLLLYYRAGGPSLNTVIGNGKRFIGYEIIRRLKAKKSATVLSLLREGVSKVEKSRAKLHQLWQGTFEVKPCRTEKFILQKLNYIHANPCKGKWTLCENGYEYLHSSAAFYEQGKRDNVLLKDYRDFLALVQE
jgi:REP element-mobilizing transposase RayT